MFRPKTLFVIGAGAGQEISLPTGAQLSERIAQKVNFERDPVGTLKSGDKSLSSLLLQKSTSSGVGLEEYYSAGRQIAKGVRYSNSIDEFINKHKDNQCIQFCAKIAIAQIILEAERASAISLGSEGSFARQQEFCPRHGLVFEGSCMMSFPRQIFQKSSTT